MILMVGNSAAALMPAQPEAANHVQPGCMPHAHYGHRDVQLHVQACPMAPNRVQLVGLHVQLQVTGLAVCLQLDMCCC